MGNAAAEEGVGVMAGGRWRPAGGVACHMLATKALENSCKKKALENSS
jgi:hypothetical protein